jgi:hypothetical protein
MGSTEYKRGSRAIARGQWQAPLGSSRGKPPDHGQPAAVLALMKGKPFGGAEEAPSVTVTVRDGDGNMRSGRKNARGAGRTKNEATKHDKNGVMHP